MKASAVRSDLQNETRDIDVVFASGEVLKVTIRPFGLSNATFKALKRIEQLGETSEGMYESLEWAPRIIVQLVAAWDLVYQEGDEEPVPLTIEGIDELDVDLVQALARKLSEAAFGAPKKTSRSSKTSSTTKTKSRRN